MTDEPILKGSVKMIELSIQMDDKMNYNICIPSKITPENFPEILKKIKAIISIIPKKDFQTVKVGTKNPLLFLEKEELKPIIENYRTFSKEDFAEFLSKEYNIQYDNWRNTVSLMGRVRERIKTLEGENENQ